MPILNLTEAEAENLRKAVVDAQVWAIDRGSTQVEVELCNLRNKLNAASKDESSNPTLSALGALALTVGTRRWLEANDPKALAQADAVLQQHAPALLENARCSVASGVGTDVDAGAPSLDADRERAEHALKVELNELRQRLQARAEFIRALEACVDAANKLVAAWEKLPQGESLGGWPEGFETFEGYAAEMAEWLREQSAEWLCNPPGTSEEE